MNAGENMLAAAVMASQREVARRIWLVGDITYIQSPYQPKLAYMHRLFRLMLLLTIGTDDYRD